MLALHRDAKYKVSLDMCMKKRSNLQACQIMFEASSENARHRDVVATDDPEAAKRLAITKQVRVQKLCSLSSHALVGRRRVCGAGQEA